MTAQNVDLIQDLAYYVYYTFELKNTLLLNEMFFYEIIII